MGGCKGMFIGGWQILKCAFNFNQGVSLKLLAYIIMNFSEIYMVTFHYCHSVVSGRPSVKWHVRMF